MTNPGGSSCRLQYHYAGILMHRTCAGLRERRRMARRPADFWLLRQSMTVGHARRQRRSAGSAFRSSGTGYYASTHEGLMVSWTASRRGSHPSSTTASVEHLPAWSKVVRSRRSTAWSTGGRSIWRNGYLRNSASRSPSRHSAGSSGRWATANSRPGRAITLRRRARSRILKKLPHPSGDGRAREGHRLRYNRNLVRRRGPHRPEEQNHSPLGEARHPPQCAARPAYRFHLHLRRGLPRAGQGRDPDPAGLQQRGDEPASCRDRQSGRARCPCHPFGRSSWLALVDPPRRARKYHHHYAAAKMPRAQSGRKRLAVFARQLALEPRLQILRRSRRPLLQRLEQARQSALAHHVHWTAPMGAPVLINGRMVLVVPPSETQARLSSRSNSQDLTRREIRSCHPGLPPRPDVVASATWATDRQI